jgi:hypothetical protein
VAPWERSEFVQRFPGVIGEYTLQGQKHSRTIAIPFELTGYSTHVTLQAAVHELGGYQGETGTLTYDLGGGDSASWTQVIFLGFDTSEDPWKDGSGVSGWHQKGTLKFRQVAS